VIGEALHWIAIGVLCYAALVVAITCWFVITGDENKESLLGFLLIIPVLFLLFSDSLRLLVVSELIAFVCVVIGSLVTRRYFTIHGRLESGATRKKAGKYLGHVFQQYSMNESRNKEVTRAIDRYLSRSKISRDWESLVSGAAVELMSVKSSAERIKSLGISARTADDYRMKADEASESLWRMTERIMAVYENDYFSEVVKKRLELEQRKVKRLVDTARLAREALAQLALTDGGSREMENASLQLQALAEAT
jgi:hypothetical protein